MIHKLNTVNELTNLHKELGEKNIGFYAFVFNPKIGDELTLIRSYFPTVRGMIIVIEPYPEYYYDLGDMIFETVDDMRHAGIDYVLKIYTTLSPHVVYVGYNFNGLPVFYDMDLKH